MILSASKSISSLSIIDSTKNSSFATYQDLNYAPGLSDFPLSNLGYQDLNSYTFDKENLFPDSKEFLSRKIRAYKHENPLEKKYNYIDYSQIPDEEVLASLNIVHQPSKSPEPFPVKLHKIIERNEIDGYANIISWLPHGRAFRIVDTNGFATKVMPNYFYISKISSFIRQLSIYGFRKVSRKGIDKGCYYHDLFLQGRQGLCAGIVRLKTRPTLKSKWEPNFYTMPAIRRFDLLANNHYGQFEIKNTPEKPRVIQYHFSETFDDKVKKDQSESKNKVFKTDEGNSGENILVKNSVPHCDEADFEELMNALPVLLEEDFPGLYTEIEENLMDPFQFDDLKSVPYHVCTNNSGARKSNICYSSAA